MRRFIIIGDKKYTETFRNLVKFIERQSFQSIIISEILELQSYLSLLTQTEVPEIVILDFYTDYEEFNLLFSELSQIPISSSIMHVTFFLDEYYTTHNNYNYNNTYLVSQYLQLNDEKSTYKIFNLSENEYIDNRIYGIVETLTFLSSSNEDTYKLTNSSFYQLFQALTTNYIINYNDIKLFDHNIIRNSYFSRVNESGNVVDIIDLNSDIPEYPLDEWVYENQNICINGIEQKEDVFLMGFMSVTTEYSMNYFDTIRGIVETVDYINSNV